MKYKIFILILVLIQTGISKAAEKYVDTAFYVQAKTDKFPQSLKLGEKVGVTVSVTMPKGKGFQLIVPHWPAATKMELTDSLYTDSQSHNPDFLSFFLHYRASAYDSGTFYFPALEYKLMRNGQLFKSVTTDSFGFKYRMMPVDTSKAFMPIKSPEEIPYTFADIWPYLVGGVLLLALLFLGWRYGRKYLNRPKAVAEAKIPTKSAEEEALEALAVLSTAKESLEGKSYFTDLTDILRRYISRVYDIDAQEMTSEEILYALAPVSRSQVSVERLSQVLRLSDLVKFAKYEVMPYQKDSSLTQAYDFIRETAPKAEETQAKLESRSEDHRIN